MQAGKQAAQQYGEEGFCVADGPLWPAATMASAAAGADEVREGRFDTGVPPQNEFVYRDDALCKINNAHLANRALYSLLTDGVLGAWVADVSGAAAVQVWASQLLVKPPAAGEAGNVGWHQDRQYWGYWREDEGLLTAWIALRPVAADMGPLTFVRASHRWGLLEGGDFFSGDLEGVKDRLGGEGRAWTEIEAPLEAGGASLHHCLTLHGSGPNRSGAPRLSLAVHLRTEAAQPLADSDDYWVAHLDDPDFCPVIHGAL